MQNSWKWGVALIVGLFAIGIFYSDKQSLDTEMTLTAPKAPLSPKSFTYHGITVQDPYSALKDESYPLVDDEEVLAYLRAENDYFEAHMSPYRTLVDSIFEELKGRLKEDDASVPVKDGNYLYSWRFEEGAEYRLWVRTSLTGNNEEIILDENARAEEHEFFTNGGMDVSPDHTLLAWSEDLNGSERFTMHVKNLATGDMLGDEIPETLNAPVWAEDGNAFFYLEINEHWRPYRVKLHRLGTSTEDDPVIYEEKDGSFFVGLGKSQSREFIIISTGDHVTSEVRIVPAHDPLAQPVLIAARKKGLEYYVDHGNGRFFIRTNDTHKNFRIVTAPENDPIYDNWQELVPGSDKHYLRGMVSFGSFLALQERVGGLDQIRIRAHDGGEHFIEFPESAYAVSIGHNPEADTRSLRLNYESMVTPDTVFDYHLDDQRLETLKIQEIPSGYDASNYKTERLMATARDGVQVPVSIVYHKNFPLDGSGKLHLYGYGAYGFGIPPRFSTARLSLLDRGFAYAIAHVRGGDEMGYQWYQDGKLFKRTNTFHDFVDVARFLIEENYTKTGNISISGGSAGGELMGYVANSNPELWRVVVAHVPFVDVLNTMLDDSLPLTPIEWPEWGNPITDKAAFEYILSYSPYDNITAQDYAPMLVTAGLNDPRVTYWEPAKWVARLRATKTDDNLLLLKTNMGAGHRGKSGRFDSLNEVAEEYVFILKAFGMAIPDG